MTAINLSKRTGEKISAACSPFKAAFILTCFSVLRLNEWECGVSSVSPTKLWLSGSSVPGERVQEKKCLPHGASVSPWLSLQQTG